MNSRRVSVLVTCGGGQGGVQRSLIALLQRLRADDFQIVVIVDRLEGGVFKELPTHVDLRLAPAVLREVVGITNSWRSLLRACLLRPLWVIPVVAYLAEGRQRNRKRLWARLWRASKKDVLKSIEIPAVDLAINYSGFMGVWDRFVVECVNAQHSVCWVHGDAQRVRSRTVDEPTLMDRYSRFVAVSEACSALFITAFPGFADRTDVIYNSVPRGRVVEQANEEISDELPPGFLDGAELVLSSVGRLDVGKGHCLGLQAIRMLRGSHPGVRWMIVGSGPEEGRLREIVAEQGLEENVAILGHRDNPFAFVSRSDALFHPSSSEGHSIAIEEARVLGKPVIATAYPTVASQVVDGVDGVVTGFDPEEIATRLAMLIEHREMLSAISDGASRRPMVPAADVAFTALCEALLGENKNGPVSE